MTPLLLPAPDPRKAAIVALVPRTVTTAEIGADQGILSAYLLRTGAARRVVVADISAASLDKARRFFALHSLTDRALFRVADGLNALDGPVGAVLLAGLGGRTILDIVARGLERLTDTALILQPNTGVALVRRFLAERGFRVDAERLAWDGRRYYVALRAVCGAERLTEKELLFGPRLLRDRPPEWHGYLAWRRVCLLAERKGRGNCRAVAWIDAELQGE